MNDSTLSHRGYSIHRLDVPDNSCYHGSKKDGNRRANASTTFTKQDAAEYWGKARSFLRWLCILPPVVGESRAHARPYSQSNDYKTQDFEKASLGILIIRSTRLYHLTFFQLHFSHLISDLLNTYIYVYIIELYIYVFELIFILCANHTKNNISASNYFYLIWND